MFPIAVAGVTAALVYSMTAGPRNTITMTASYGTVYDMQNLPNKEAAVELMAKVRKNLIKLRDTYANDMGSSDTSYSENKGQKIVVCLRDKTKAPHYPIIEENTIMFVMLHEMAHLMTETIGHTAEFWANFKRILHDGVKVGIYSPVNYARQPTPYCGMTITDSPI